LLYRLTGTNSPNNNGDNANGSLIDAAHLIPAPEGIRVCLSDGNNRRGEITIGDSNSQTATEVFISNGISAVCKNA